MEVKLLKSIASPSYSYATGETVKLETARANEFIKYGIAEVTETAVKKPLKEKTVKEVPES